MNTGSEWRDYSGLRLLGGRLCLDFVNTMYRRYPHFDGEHLTSYTDLLSWSRYVGILTLDEAATLTNKALQHPETAASVFHQAIRLREALYRIFVAVIHKQAISATDLALLNTGLSNALPNLMVQPIDAEFQWGWGGSTTALDRMLWAIARSAADILTSADLLRVNECPEEQGCGWLFLDTSKNHSRRWCSMEGCGNTAKARRHYRKQRVSDD